jgi:hypothetical protein
LASLRGPKYFLRQGTGVTEFSFFISSGSDVVEQRNLFEEMVRTVDEQFWHRGNPEKRFALRTMRWEHDAPYRSKDPNKDFVLQARISHATIVLLSTQVRPGTREEIEGVLKEPRTQLSVVWMRMPDRRVRDLGLRKFLKDHQSDFLDLETGPPGSADAALAMLRVIAAAVADITNEARNEELFYERR